MARYDDRNQHAEYDPHPPIRPRKRRRLWPWVILAAVVLLVILGLVNSGSTPQTTTGPASGQAEPVNPDAADAAQAPGPVTDDDAEAVLTFGATYTGDDGLQITAAAPKTGDATLGATYCALVSYVNGTDNPVAFGIFDWKMVDSEGVEGTATFAGGKTVDSGLGQGNLRPGGKKTGEVCWDKQGTGVPVEVIYQGGLFGDSVVWHK